jgi:LemA protein
MGAIGWMVVAVMVMAGLWAVRTYNGLVSLRQRCRQAFADSCRLVETVKGYAAHERETLENVIKGRNAALAAQGPTAQALAEGQLQGAPRQIFALAEAYPELKANQNFQQLQGAPSDLENMIAAAPLLHHRGGRLQRHTRQLSGRTVRPVHGGSRHGNSSTSTRLSARPPKFWSLAQAQLLRLNCQGAG